MFSDPIFLSRKLRTKRAVTNYIGASSDGQRRDKMIKQTTKSNNCTHSSEELIALLIMAYWMAFHFISDLTSDILLILT